MPDHIESLTPGLRHYAHFDLSLFPRTVNDLLITHHRLSLSQERIEYSKTFQGKYFNFLGYFFSIYCVWKIFMVRTFTSVFLHCIFLSNQPINTTTIVCFCVTGHYKHCVRSSWKDGSSDEGYRNHSELLGHPVRRKTHAHTHLQI